MGVHKMVCEKPKSVRASLCVRGPVHNGVRRSGESGKRGEATVDGVDASS